MAIPRISPQPQKITECMEWCEGCTSSELDALYRRFWRYVSNLEDHESETADRYWATIFAIERRQQYRRGAVNAVRCG